MLEAATPIIKEMIIKEGMQFKENKTFNLEENFTLKISINETLLFFELDKLNSFPKKDYKIYLSLDELGRINKFFNQFESTQEVLVSFDTLISKFFLSKLGY